jgi:hypothetical protein
MNKASRINHSLHEALNINRMKRGNFNWQHQSRRKERRLCEQKLNNHDSMICGSAALKAR